MTAALNQTITFDVFYLVSVPHLAKVFNIVLKLDPKKT